MSDPSNAFHSHQRSESSELSEGRNPGVGNGLGACIPRPRFAHGREHEDEHEYDHEPNARLPGFVSLSTAIYGVQ